MMENLSDGLGYISTISFFFQYLPQMIKNYNRKTTEGFSTSAMVVKLLGASFLCFNNALDGERGFVLLYGIISMCQYLIMIGQAAMYSGPMSGWFLLLIPLPVLLVSFAMPDSRPITTGLKPASQIIGHLLLLKECIRIRSVRGISLISHGQNLLGGCCGIIAILLVPAKSAWTLLLYVNSTAQATSIFALNWWYKKQPEFDVEPASPSTPGSPCLIV
eukprot:TRINITY_DN33606_c0_g1_i1.p1 TRINITY_DN33606_c0_g1~~TRINITY_DN33606_c0_g1_i1.p1  ORF type:complete len:218 (+),score=10.15 TRINITY_DN33606_c0_g1_i1:268-921(+)